MINGGHVVIHSRNAEADRDLFRNDLQFSYVDVHGGWLIFKLSPSEVAFHPSDENDLHELYLMTDAAIGAAMAWIAFNGNLHAMGGSTIRLAVTPGPVTGGIAFAAMLGLVGGLFPAIRAARLPVAIA